MLRYSFPRRSRLFRKVYTERTKKGEGENVELEDDVERRSSVHVLPVAVEKKSRRARAAARDDDDGAGGEEVSRWGSADDEWWSGSEAEDGALDHGVGRRGGREDQSESGTDTSESTGDVGSSNDISHSSYSSDSSSDGPDSTEKGDSDGVGSEDSDQDDDERPLKHEPLQRGPRQVPPGGQRLQGGPRHAQRHQTPPRFYSGPAPHSPAWGSYLDMAPGTLPRSRDTGPTQGDGLVCTCCHSMGCHYAHICLYTATRTVKL